MALKEVKYEVTIFEMERGWGQRQDGVRLFDTKEEAEVFIKEFNKDNNKEVVPDWYMYASNAVPKIVEGDE